jgi:serine/threonine-protein kinase
MLFLREAQAAAKLVHPNVVAAFDAGEAGGHFFLVLEYVDGPNLDQLVRQQGPLPVNVACDFIKQTANGLQAAHTLGMVHRDIKPANLLVQRSDRGYPDSSGSQEHWPGLIKVSDFGLARLHSPETGATKVDLGSTICTTRNTVMGTPDFLSPEQARDLHDTDIRSDLYSLGCTFYFLLTGQVPFPGGTALEKLIRHNTEQPAPLEDFRSDLPAKVIDIVQRLLSKKPEERYQTPRELAEMLEPFALRVGSQWEAPPASSNPDLDADVTPMNELETSSSDVLEENSWDEWSAMQSTGMPDLSPTPMTATIRTRTPSTKRRLSRGEKMMLLCFFGVAVLLFALLAVLMALVE